MTLWKKDERARVRRVISGLILGDSRRVRIRGLGCFISTPNLPAWAKVAVSMVWLLVIIAFAFVLGNQKSGTEEARREFRHIVRNNFVYLAIAVVPVTVLVAFAIHDVDQGIQRNVKENCVFCTITAAAVLSFLMEEFWRLRRYWQMWAILAAYAILHFSIGVPAFAHWHRIRAGYISVVATPELMLVSYFLYLLEDKHAHSLR